MEIKVSKIENIEPDSSIAILASKNSAFDVSFLSQKEYNYVQKRIDKGDSFITVNQLDRLVFVIILDHSKDKNILLEEARKAGYKVQNQLNDSDQQSLNAFHAENDSEVLLAFTEGILLGSYRYLRFFSKPQENNVSLKQIGLICQPLLEKQIHELVYTTEILYEVRNMINDPVSHLNAVQLSERISELCSKYGCTVEILQKSQIEALKMGGLLAVNKGSVDPPTFTIVEWKPSNAINNKPIILVGKGVVYDTGGLSLKPTTDSMDYMKCDMSGAAIVAGVLAAAAANQLPLHLVALIPATDNRPSGNAYAPGDVVTISDGTTVEVLNSDAEGRMILADALVYAKKYDPELVIDVATLTGSASMAIGPYALVAMGTANKEIKEKIVNAGNYVYERVVEFPLWDEYAELLKSDIADIKNVGGKYAGAITGGKFLQHFTSYPWMHFDIAGVAFSKKNDNYRGKGGTGFGMRLLYQFLRQTTNL